MSRCMKLVAMTLLVALTFAVSVMAQGERRNCRRSINERQVNQQSRIGRGIRSDELTRLEVARLERQQGVSHLLRLEPVIRVMCSHLANARAFRAA